MKNHFTMLLFLLAVGIFTLPSCLPEFNFNADDLDNKWQPGIAIPLLNTTLTLENVLDNFSNDGFFTVGSDNLITVVYRGKTLSLSGGELFSLPDLAFPMLTPTQNTPVPLPNGIEFDNITLKNGKLTYSASSIQTQPVNVTLTMTDLTDNGTPYQVQFQIPASNGMSATSFTDSVNIADYNLSFTNGEFTTAYNATFANGIVTTLVGMTIEMEDLEYTYMDGYFGNANLALNPSKSAIDLFTNWQQGNINFVEPKLRLIFNNSFGMPIRLSIDSLSATTNFNGVVPFQSANLTTFDIAPAPMVGGIEKTEILLDNTNSNIAALLSGVPYEFYYDFGAQTNPANNPSVMNFLTDSSRVTVDVDVELPMYGSIGLFAIRDTLELDFNEYKDIDAMKLKLTTDNGFPFEVQTQIYFLDETNQVMDSLFTGSTTFLASASVDANGIVTSSTVNVQEQTLTANRFAALKERSKRSVLVGRLYTSNGGLDDVKILTSYQTTFQLGAVIVF